MNEKTTSYITEHEKKHRARVLIDAGLYKKVYLEDLASDDYDPAYVEFDSDTLKNYLKVPYEVTDEEFEELEKYVITRGNTEESRNGRNISSELWNWAANIKRFGVVLLILLIIWGLFDAYNSSQIPRLVEDYSYSMEYEVETDSMEYEVETEVSGEVFITVFASWLLAAIIEFGAYNAISLLLSALASIVENTQKTADAAAYNACKKE